MHFGVTSHHNQQMGELATHDVSRYMTCGMHSIRRTLAGFTPVPVTSKLKNTPEFP